MEKADVLARIAEKAFIAMLRMPTPDDALDMAEVLIEAGISCLQVPLTVPSALDVIFELRKSSPTVVVAAGTVLDPKNAEACIEAGAHLIISPVVNVATIGQCNEAGVPVVAGALTPTEVLTAWDAGADLVRIYPCAAMGGPAYVKFLRTPLPQIRLVPAGGISIQTAAEYIAAGATALEVESDLVDLDALHGGRTQDIVTNAHLYLDVMGQALALANA